MNRIYLQLFAEEGEPDNGGSEQNQAEPGNDGSKQNQAEPGKQGGTQGNDNGAESMRSTPMMTLTGLSPSKKRNG